jgi:hypothetical protein
MRRSERDALRAAYQYRCGYCGTTEVAAGGELTVDHFHPLAHGGEDTPDNWVYACLTCNDHKLDYWRPDSVDRILHPQRDDVASHLCQGEDGRLSSLTRTGQFHIERLRLNRPQLVRRRLRQARLQSVREELSRLTRENAVLLRRMRAVEEQLELLMDQAWPDIEQ